MDAESYSLHTFEALLSQSMENLGNLLSCFFSHPFSFELFISIDLIIFALVLRLISLFQFAFCVSSCWRIGLVYARLKLPYIFECGEGSDGDTSIMQWPASVLCHSIEPLEIVQSTRFLLITNSAMRIAFKVFCNIETVIVTALAAFHKLSCIHNQVAQFSNQLSVSCST